MTLRVLGIGAMTCLHGTASAILIWFCIQILKLGDLGVGTFFGALALLVTCSWLMWSAMLDRELKGRR